MPRGGAGHCAGRGDRGQCPERDALCAPRGLSAAAQWLPLTPPGASGEEGVLTAPRPGAGPSTLPGSTTPRFGGAPWKVGVTAPGVALQRRLLCLWLPELFVGSWRGCLRAPPGKLTSETAPRPPQAFPGREGSAWRGSHTASLPGAGGPARTPAARTWTRGDSACSPQARVAAKGHAPPPCDALDTRGPPHPAA